MNPLRWLRRDSDAERSGAAAGQPVEVGTVTWGRDLAASLAQSQESGKPVFALFQEVPGCAGCKQFGADVLSDPLVVDAIHEAFVPLLIHNNSPGPDAEVLARYGEPAWNFQVVRFLGPDGEDVIERRDRVWDTGPLVARMIEALTATERPVPPFLRLLEQETSERLQHFDIAQDCFWVGETMLGRMDGVVTTEAGFVDGLEVTRVAIDPAIVDAAAVIDQASQAGVATVVFADDPTEPALGRVTVPLRPSARYTPAPVSDQKRQLGGRFDGSDLSLGQLTKLNGFAPTGSADGATFLSHRQRHTLA